MCEWIGEWLADGEINWYVNDWWHWVAGWSERPINACASRRIDGWVNVVGWAGAGGGQAWVERGWLKGRSRKRGWVGALKALRHQNWKSVSSTSQDFTMSLRKLETLHHLVPTIPWWFNLQRTWSSPSSYLCSIPCGEQSLESKGLALVCPGSHEKQASSFQHPDLTRLDRESIKSKEESSATSHGMTTSLSASGLSFIGGQSWGI